MRIAVAIVSLLVCPVVRADVAVDPSQRARSPLASAKTRGPFRSLAAYCSRVAQEPSTPRCDIVREVSGGAAVLAVGDVTVQYRYAMKSGDAWFVDERPAAGEQASNGDFRFVARNPPTASVEAGRAQFRHIARVGISGNGRSSSFCVDMLVACGIGRGRIGKVVCTEPIRMAGLRVDEPDDCAALEAQRRAGREPAWQWSLSARFAGKAIEFKLVGTIPDELACVSLHGQAWPPGCVAPATSESPFRD